ncbi:hypothetical protein [Haladaptatus halobius]|uniref:hypothetical protein n=1 Tax=Haladaptatus halobius TaxID=2884875 RepID=UPI001D0B4F75|nr:hypothetical protein [Haladaptatus halobius]
MSERIEGHEAFDIEADRSTIPSEPKIADHGHDDEENDHLAFIYDSRDGQFST